MAVRKPGNPLDSCIGFEWDEWNVSKNWVRHRVTTEEAESIFFHDPLLLRTDTAHSEKEKRYQVLGETVSGRALLIVFTIRKKMIRVISARDMSRKESEAYNKYEKENS
jgi:uncharacterized DUF497 family protein